MGRITECRLHINSMLCLRMIWLKRSMYVVNKSGPKIDPWGTPQRTGETEKRSIDFNLVFQSPQQHTYGPQCQMLK